LAGIPRIAESWKKSPQGGGKKGKKAETVGRLINLSTKKTGKKSERDFGNGREEKNFQTLGEGKRYDIPTREIRKAIWGLWQGKSLKGGESALVTI